MRKIINGIVYNSETDDFIKNAMTILAEEIKTFRKDVNYGKCS